MSTVLMRREVPPVCFDGRECGIEFAIASADVQLEFLLGWCVGAKNFSWPMQCRAIVDEMNADDRSAVAYVLERLLEHVKEPIQ